MAIAFSVSSESHPATTASVSQASFTWSHAHTGTPQGVLVYVFVCNAATATATSVTYGSQTLTLVGTALDNVSELGHTSAYFFGSALPAGTQTITVNRTNNTNQVYAAAVTVTAATTNTEIFGLTAVSNDSTLGAVNVDDGLTGAEASLRFGGTFTGLNAPPAAAAGSTLLQSIDLGNFGAALVRETTAGSGSRPVGFATSANDDTAAIYTAIREVLPAILLADVSNFVLSGPDTGLLEQVCIVADAASFQLNAPEALFGKTFLTGAATESFTLNGLDLLIQLSTAAPAAGFTLAAGNANLPRALRLVADTASLALNGTASFPQFSTPAALVTYALVGGNADGLRALRLQADSSSFALGSTNTILGYGFSLVAEAGVYQFQATAAGFSPTLPLSAGNFAVNGFSANFPRSLSVDTTSFALSAFASFPQRSTPAAVGSFAVGSSPNNLLRSLRLTASTANFTGSNSANLNRGLIVVAVTSNFILGGVQATFPLTTGFTGASFVLTGRPIDSQRQLTSVADPANFTLILAAPLFTRIAVAIQQSYFLSASNSNFIQHAGRLLIADTASTDLATYPAVLTVTRSPKLVGANFSIVNNNAELLKSSYIQAVRARYLAEPVGAVVAQQLRFTAESTSFTATLSQANYLRDYTLFAATTPFLLSQLDINVIATLKSAFYGDNILFQGSNTGLYRNFTLAGSSSLISTNSTNTGIYLSSRVFADVSQFSEGTSSAELVRSLIASFTAGQFLLNSSITGFVNTLQGFLKGSIGPTSAPRYTGNNNTSQSFQRPQYLSFNTALKARDLGFVDNLYSIVSGKIGSQAGTNTTYIKVETIGPATLRITKNLTSKYTNANLDVGILDADRKPIQLTELGFAISPPERSTNSSNSLVNLPAGIYYFTISTSSWQTVDYSVTLQVIRYVGLAGAILGTLTPYARFSAARPAGAITLNSGLRGSIPANSLIKTAFGSAGGSLLPRITLGIMKGSAGGTLTPYGQLKQTHRLSGGALLTDQSAGSLISTPSYGGGYGY